MEKEQIVKVLECCAEGNGIEDCMKCPFREDCDDTKLARLALSLILEQEKRIEALTLEYAGFEAGAKDVARFIQAATVRKMLKRIKEDAVSVSLLSNPPKFMLEIREDALDQIAKELLEDVTPPHKAPEP